MSDSSRRGLTPLAGWFVVVSLAGLARAEEPAGRPIVAGFERFFAEAGQDDVAGGRLLIGELNCTSCHRGDEAAFAPLAKKVAPILDKVGSRVRVEHLRAFLANPHQIKPGTTMPAVLAENAGADVEALVHFLATTGSVTEKAIARKQVAAGKVLYEQAGCAACHGVPGEKSAPLATTTPLGDLAGKYTFASLAAFVADPLACRPSGRMPSLNLKEGEAQSIASFLLKDARVDVPPTLAYRYYEGDWENLPDFDILKPATEGMADGFDVELAGRHSNYALRFEGTIEVERAASYNFHLSSDDGSRLWIDDKLVVDNDGIHPNSHKAARTRLTRGRHKVVVGFFQGGGEEELTVEFEGPGLSRRPLEMALVLPEGLKPAGPASVASRFEVDPAKVEKGRGLFASLGCASCHQLKEGDKRIEPRSIAKALADLNAEAGCLAAEPPRGVPDYDLSTRQRAAIAAALKAPAAPAPTDREAISRTMVAFNCYACHVRDGVGGVEEGRDSYFATTQKEMGDEGRIPPLLTGVGGKLTREWLSHVLADGAKDRPYMLTRMPRFGEANVGHLVQPLETVDAVAPVPVPHFDQPEKRIKATGRFLVGSQAFNCGSCHQFQEFQAAGIQALDMTLMTRRLRRDWFSRYVVNPPAFRPGTRMPTAWPDGQSTLGTVYDGDTARQVESIWVYLSDGPKAAVPYGLGRDPIPLVADKGAVIYRNFIQGAGPRAIGVGYPEKGNLAFDANDLRLALIWQGHFIDASKHWTGRGEGFQGPLGDNILSLPAGPSFAVLADEKAEWPRHRDKEGGDRFKGYYLTGGGRPVFEYEVGKVRVEDFPEAVSGGDVPTLRRTIDLTAGGGSPGLYFRAAVGKKIEPLGQDWFAVDGEWKVRLSTDSKPIVRESNGKVELIVPVRLEGGKARIIQEYAW